MTNEEIAGFFNNARLHIECNPNLRDPQVEGWFRTRQHFRNSSEYAILQIPVGCGKTGLMALLLGPHAGGPWQVRSRGSKEIVHLLVRP